MGLTVRRCGVTVARVGVARLHRHLSPPPGALAAFEVLCDRWPVGWALVGRPASRVLQEQGWVEVTRCAHDGTPNAGSALYGACARWARTEAAARLGGIRGHDALPVITYTLPSESGASLRGAGWVVIGATDPKRSPTWSGRPSRTRQRGRLDGIRKPKWAPPWCADG